MASNLRGVSMEQDGRWSKSDAKLLQQMIRGGKFPAIMDSKVNFRKVNMNVIQRWINERVIQLTGVDDDITVNTIINFLQAPDVNPKQMQISVGAVLSSNAGKFMEELWSLLVDAQNQPGGVPSILTDRLKVNEQHVIPLNAASSRITIEGSEREQKEIGTHAEEGDISIRDTKTSEKAESSASNRHREPRDFSRDYRSRSRNRYRPRSRSRSTERRRESSRRRSRERLHSRQTSDSSNGDRPRNRGDSPRRRRRRSVSSSSSSSDEAGKKYRRDSRRRRSSSSESS